MIAFNDNSLSLAKKDSILIFNDYHTKLFNRIVYNLYYCWSLRGKVMVYNYSDEETAKETNQFSGRLYNALSILRDKTRLIECDKPTCLSELLRHGGRSSWDITEKNQLMFELVSKLNEIIDKKQPKHQDKYNVLVVALDVVAGKKTLIDLDQAKKSYPLYNHSLFFHQTENLIRRVYAQCEHLSPTPSPIAMRR